MIWGIKDMPRRANACVVPYHAVPLSLLLTVVDLMVRSYAHVLAKLKDPDNSHLSYVR